MKMLAAVGEVPEGKAGSFRSKYQDVIDTVRSLEYGLWLPVECKDGNEANRLFSSMRAVGMRIKQRWNVLYLQKR